MIEMKSDPTSNDMPKVFRQIRNSDLCEIEKLTQAFQWMTSRILALSEKEIELARAMKDEEALIREQIKYEVMKSARGIFQECYRAMFGRKAWDE
jgi:hypothetical protein